MRGVRPHATPVRRGRRGACVVAIPRGIVCGQSLTALRRVLQVVVDKTAYRVSGIRLMQTSMINTKTKQKLYMPNVVLARMFIENDERSPHARATVRGCCGRVCVWRVRAAGDLCCRSAQVDIYVDPGVTALQIKLLHERLTDFMRHESPDDWMQPAEPYVIASDVRVRCVACGVCSCPGGCTRLASRMVCARRSRPMARCASASGRRRGSRGPSARPSTRHAAPSWWQHCARFETWACGMNGHQWTSTSRSLRRGVARNRWAAAAMTSRTLTTRVWVALSAMHRSAPCESAT